MTPTAEKPADLKPMPAMRRKRIPIGLIEKVPGMQVRGWTDPDKVARFEEIIGEYGEMDAVDVFHVDPESTRFLLADGFSRMEAYARKGVDFIPCNIRVGDEAAALEFALSRNGHHGSQMTNAEKRAAAELAVLHPKVGLKSDADIARMIGCSPTLVGQARRGETKQQSSAKTKERVQKSSGGGSGSSANLVPVTAHQRKAPNAPPTKAAILKQIEEWVDRDQVDEAEVVGLFEAKGAHYVWLPMPGQPVSLKVVGKSGREQILINVIVKELAFNQVVLKNEGPKVSLVEE